MAILYIKIKSIADIKRISKIAEMNEGDVDIISGRYIVDAKSIMGIFSLDLSKTLEVAVHHPINPKVMELLKEWEVSNEG